MNKIRVKQMTLINVEDLNNEDVTSLLKNHPDWFDKLPIEKMKAYNWVDVISDQPDLISKVPIKFSPHDFALILYLQPQLIHLAPVEKITADTWSWLLSNQPQLIKHIKKEDLAKFSKQHWDILIDAHPELEEYRP